MNWQKIARDREAAFKAFVVEHIAPHCSEDVRPEIQARLGEKEADLRAFVVEHVIASFPRATRLEIQAKLEDELAAALATKDSPKWEALDPLVPLLWQGFPLFEGVDDAS